jgi:DNA-binding transcriptional MerR regulator/methylmalonyl-CoA mutase cobalamin-binding subunit
MTPKAGNSSKDPMHPVRLVSARTGLSSHVLRVWERRYGAVHPVRSPGGQRLYTDADVARLQLLRDAAQAGRSIKQLVSLPNEALRELIATDQQYREQPRAAAPTIPSADKFEPAQVLRACLDAVSQFDPERLVVELRRATVHLPLAQLTDEVLAPLLAEIGVQWMQGHLGPAHEHAASVVVHRILDDIVRSCAPSPDAPSIVVCTPMGQLHELGALLVAACAAAAGWRVTYLGSDLPAADIARAAERVGAAVVALSILHPASDAQLRADLDSLVDLLPPRRQVVVGGSSAASYARHLHSRGVLELESLAAFREFLSRHAAAATA